MNAPITDAMLVAAATIDDLDESVKSVMDQVGITDGGVAGMVFTGGFEERWPTATQPYRLAMLDRWRKTEALYQSL